MESRKTKIEVSIELQKYMNVTGFHQNWFPNKQFYFVLVELLEIIWTEQKFKFI